MLDIILQFQLTKLKSLDIKFLVLDPQISNSDQKITVLGCQIKISEYKIPIYIAKISNLDSQLYQI